MARKCFVSNRWRNPLLIVVLFVLELVFTVPVLVLFAVADPDTYRDKLREDGFRNGFNSSPAQYLYAAANNRVYHSPFVWSQFLTSYNVVISVLSTFMLLVKAVMFVLHIWWPPLSMIIHGALTLLWAVSVHGQSGSDLSDHDFPQPGAPWYITKSCSVAFTKTNVHYCVQAKSAFAISIIIMSLFAINTIWAIWSMVPTRKQRLARQRRYDDNVDSDYESDSEDEDDDVAASKRRNEKEDVVELHDLPAAENGTRRTAAAFIDRLKVPMTPRTRTMHRLEGEE